MSIENASGVEMEIAGGRDDPSLIGETLLAEVFKLLPFEERLQVVPLVCKSWRKLSHDPTCWRNVDMKAWFQKRVENDFTGFWEFDFRCEEEMEFYIKKVVDRSGGQLRELQTMHCSDAAIKYIAERCPSLTALSIQDSLYATNQSVLKLAENCRKLQKLNLSDCYNIEKDTLEAFGRNCMDLLWLARNMVRTNDFLSLGPVLDGDDEAIIICQQFRNLKHLEMQKSNFSDVGLAHIAKGCRQLEVLNLAACPMLSPYTLQQVPKFCPNLKQFVKPIVPRLHVNPKFLMVLFD